ncbi:MAG: AI-2E family transporter, partial [Alistipes sp.]|nr:AI-2E family transporter [Alistipes sp.]
MFSVREKYWRYSLFVLILGMGVTIFVELAPLLGGLLGAATIYILLRKQMVHLTESRKWRRSAAATLLLVEAILCFLVPLSLIIWMLVSRVQDLVENSPMIVAHLRRFAEIIESRTGFDLWEESSVSSLLGYFSRFGQWVIHSIFRFMSNIIALLFVLY